MDRNVVIITIGRVVQMAITLVSVRIFTSLLTAGEVGNLYLINTLFGFFALALISPMGLYINRKLHQWVNEKTVFNRFALFNGYLLLLAAISIVFVLILNRYWQVGKTIELPMLMLIIMLSIYFTTWNQTIIPALNLLGHRISFVVFTILTLLLGLSLSIFFVMKFSITAVAWLCGQLGAQMLVAFFALVYLRRVVGGEAGLSTARKVLTRENLLRVMYFVLPLGCTTFFMWMQNQSYRIIIDKMLGAEFLGLIGLGIGVASSIAVAAESLIQQLYLPGFYREINTQDVEKRTAAWNSMAQLTIPVYISLTIMVSCLAPFLIKILANEKFAGAYLFVVFGAWIEFFRMTTNTLASVAHSEMRTKYLLRAYFVGGLLTVGGTFFCGRLNSYELAIPTLLVLSGFILMVIMYYDMKCLMQIKVGIRQIGKTILLSLPFTLAIPFFTLHPTLPVSLLLVGLCGSYFLIMHYYLTPPVLKKRILS